MHALHIVWKTLELYYLLKEMGRIMMKGDSVRKRLETRWCFTNCAEGVRGQELQVSLSEKTGRWADRSQW
jgi:hypothetical protein